MKKLFLRIDCVAAFRDPEFNRVCTALKFLTLFLCLVAGLVLSNSFTPRAAEVAKIPIAFLIVEVERPLALSRLDWRPDDLGMAGGNLAIKDNNTTGRFTKQSFTLEEVRVQQDGDAVAALNKLIESGIGFVIVDAPADVLLKLADAAKGKDVALINASATDDQLREENCRANVLHTAPSRAMLADALAQYLIWKKWNKWFLVHGAYPEDKAFANAIKRSAKRFGGKIVDEREYKFERGASRTDGGHEQIQKQLIIFTQKAPDHDILVVADESETFGPYMPYRSWLSRPVAGTAGLSPMTWHPAHEQWGATQMQNRFFRGVKRYVRPLDYNVWIAVRLIGEAATRSKSADFKGINAYLRGPEISIAGFKGQKLTFRPWNGQLRQPILVATRHIPVSWSPQEGFLHQSSYLDTLGYDKPESKCNLN